MEVVLRSQVPARRALRSVSCGELRRCACTAASRLASTRSERLGVQCGASGGLLAALASVRAAAACAARREFHATQPTTTPRRDPYEVLGVPRTASATDLKKAYFQLAKKYHPDVNKSDKDAEKKFAEINAAYEILKDDEKRKAFDQFGHQGVDAHEQGGFGGRPGAGPSMEEILREFAQAFGGGAGGMGGMGGMHMGGFGRNAMEMEQGEDVDTSVNIGFMDAVNGCSREVTYDAGVACGTCSGSGNKPGSKPTTCSACRGRGFTVINMGFVKAQAMCGQCGGAGQTAPSCGGCGGSGVQKKRQTTSIDIPAGVSGGMTMTLQGKGSAGPRGAPPGDLNIRIQVGEHPFFLRRGYDVFIEAPITLAQAALGTTIEVPTLTGAVDLKVPAGTQPGEQRVLRGKGVRIMNTKSHGNLYVNFRVHVPKKLTPRMKELFEELGKEDPVAPARQAFTFTGAQGAETAGGGKEGRSQSRGKDGGFFSKFFGGKQQEEA